MLCRMLRSPLLVGNFLVVVELIIKKGRKGRERKGKRRRKKRKRERKGRFTDPNRDRL